MRFLIFSFIILFSINVSAECYSYTVKKGDTFSKISKKYTGKFSYWKQIKIQNNIKRKYPKVGTTLQIYVPDFVDWKEACGNIIKQRLKQKRVEDHYNVSVKIPDGIADGVRVTGVKHSAYELFEYCKYATATAEQESMYRFAIGSSGEVGMYQFKLTTVQWTFSYWKNKADFNDYELVKLLMDTRTAASIFIMHFLQLKTRYKGLFFTWKRYNNGSDAVAYANKAVKRYNEISKIVPDMCSINKQNDTIKGCYAGNIFCSTTECWCN